MELLEKAVDDLHLILVQLLPCDFCLKDLKGESDSLSSDFASLFISHGKHNRYQQVIFTGHAFERVSCIFSLFCFKHPRRPSNVQSATSMWPLSHQAHAKGRAGSRRHMVPGSNSLGKAQSITASFT